MRVLARGPPTPLCPFGRKRLRATHHHPPAYLETLRSTLCANCQVSSSAGACFKSPPKNCLKKNLRCNGESADPSPQNATSQRHDLVSL